MSSLPHIVLADDLTGAAEVAAIAHQAGLHAVVLTRLPVGPVDADVLVFDTDTRLAPPREVARRVRSAALHLRRLPHAGFFLKVDSVLRGPVLRQVSACARALGRRRTFLIPSNPSLGRVIHQGRYFVNGQPLQATAFARDPHHPRHTDEVLTLLGPARPAPALCRARARQLPLGARIVIGEASNAADIAHWAGRLDETTLPAGAADFFRAWLEHQRGEKCTGLRYTLPAGGVLLLHGTTVGPVNARALIFQGRRAPSAAVVRAALARYGAVAVAPAAKTLSDPGAPAAISAGFAGLAVKLHGSGDFRHLLIAGGATAATVLRALAWTNLKVMRVWSTGVVTLQPAAAPDFAVTLKPGSYPWPANLRHVLLDFILS